MKMTQESIRTKLQVLGNEYQTLPKNSPEANSLKDQAYALLIREIWPVPSITWMVNEVDKYFDQRYEP